MPRLIEACAFSSLVIVLVTSSALPAQTLKQTLEDVSVGDRWKYNDWEAAKAAAQISKKPILALFR